MKPVVLAIVGPTGSGKTRTAIRICQTLNAEIVSMDSMQIYRHMDIGTAKPSRAELDTVPHHMIDVAEPDERFTVSMYKAMATQAIDDILSRGKLPVLVGGTGLYLQALSYEMKLGEQGADEDLRRELRAIAEEPDGALKLHNRLQSVDPESAAKLHPNDTRRVIRALEIYETSGRTKSAQNEEAPEEGPYRILVYGLSLPRETMYARINHRVDCMIEDGLIEEVRMLLRQGVQPRIEGGAMQAIGYKEIVQALQGDISMEQAVYLIKQNSRRYAKRQWTWFRRDQRTRWFDWSEYPTEDALIGALKEQIVHDIE